MKHIDFVALNKNVTYFKKLLGNSRLCAVLKNDAYGHGLVHVARNIVQIVDCYAVGSVAEAEQISFLHKDTLILLPQAARDTERALRQNFILTVDSFDTLECVKNAASRLGLSARIHLKIDSGMSRLGFVKGDLEKLLTRIDTSLVRVEGVFSHFYGETVPQCDKQLERFEECLSLLKKSFPNAICHIANTSAALLSSKYHLDMARIGLGLYGYGCDALSPVKSVEATVISLKSVCAGSVVGYGAKYVCPTDARLAVLNIGYANGLARTLVGSKIKIGQYSVKIVAICMAMTILDIGDAPICLGDKVAVLGRGVNLSNDKVIIYELLCNLE